MSHETRTGPAATIGSALLRVVPIAQELGLPPTLAAMTDEEWTARDAAVAVEIQKREAVDLAERGSRRVAALLAAGFPARALEWAQGRSANNAIPRARSWVPAEESVLVLSGDKGCGKTVAAAWWALHASFTPRFVRATTFAASSRYDRDVSGEWLSAPGLVLDDLGAEYLDAKGSFLVDLDELIDVFYGDKKPLLITTNLKIELFKARYGSRIADRIRECAVWFSVSGGSMRAPRHPGGEP